MVIKGSLALRLSICRRPVTDVLNSEIKMKMPDGLWEPFSFRLLSNRKLLGKRETAATRQSAERTQDTTMAASNFRSYTKMRPCDGSCKRSGGGFVVFVGCAGCVQSPRLAPACGNGACIISGEI